MADQVMSGSTSVLGSGAIQRLQRFSESAGAQAEITPASVDRVLSSPGRPLESGVRLDMERRFGHDFSGVRVHADQAAQQSALDLDAHAYTIGHNIVFGAGRFAPTTREGRRLLAHELTHVVQQAPRSGPPPATSFSSEHQGRSLCVQGPMIQRQEAQVHQSPVNRSSTVSSEKWRTDVESSYRRAGFNNEANAVKFCREFGACDMLLTQEEAYRAYRQGRIDAKLGEPSPEPARTPGPASAAPVAVAGVAAPLLSGGGTAATESVVAKSALERAALQWGGRAAVSTATSTTTATVGTAAGTGAAGVATVAVPVVVGVVLIIAIVDLFSYGRFELALRRAGYIVLPNPLGVCIGLCHTSPASPASPVPLQPYTYHLRAPKFGTKEIEDWLKPSSTTKPTPVTPPIPAPKPKTDEETKKDCRLVRRAVARGNDPLSELFCSMVAMGSSYDIYSTMGVAEIDALSGRTWYECKCGFLSTVRAAKKGQFWAVLAIDRLTEQARRHLRISIHCGYTYRLAVASNEVAEFLRERLPDIDVIVVGWEPCEG